MTLDPAPGSAPGLVVCVGLPSDQIIEIAHLLRGRATVLATPDAEGARAVLANQAAPRRAGAVRRGLGLPPERFENPGPAAEQTYGRHRPEVPADRFVESDNPTAVARPMADRRWTALSSVTPSPMLDPLVAGPLFVDLAGREVTARGRRVYLSAREFDLLATLALEAGRVWSFAELTARVWQLPYLGDSDPVTSAVKRLRKRLAPVRDVEVASVRGVGYRLRVRS
ncbi:winged helix-turn-helix domain-containing protein [Promicromonospora soli]